MHAAAVQPLRTDDLDYELPSDLIATRPAEPRDAARMLVMWRSDERIEHRHVRDLPEYLQSTDALVFNNTAVAPARLIGRRADTGGKIEGLFLREIPTGDPNEILWQMMLKAGGRLTAGQKVQWLAHDGASTDTIVELVRAEQGEWIVRLISGRSTSDALEAVGWTPLPPYILQARRERGDGSSDAEIDEQDRAWYQTVYADAARRQSVAAPTAGLHFTEELLRKIDETGVKRLNVTLHVGPGTFKPVTAPTLDQHRMHAEWFEVSAQTIAALHERRGGTPPGRVIAIGTTTVRTLESLPYPLPENCGSIAKMTDLLIAPPFDFKYVDGMLTNFHLPRSTLLALVAAMVGLDRLKRVYNQAIAHGYRFYSYGDAMLILP